MNEINLSGPIGAVTRDVYRAAEAALNDGETTSIVVGGQTIAVIATEGAVADDAIVITAGEYWDTYGSKDGDDVLNAVQKSQIRQAIERYRAHVGGQGWTDEPGDDYDREDARYDSPEGQLGQAVAAALNTARSLWLAGPGDLNPQDDWPRAMATLIAGMMGSSPPSPAIVGQVLAAITAEEDEDNPLTLAARHAMMPFCCGVCGVEVNTPGQEPDHLPRCPVAPDAKADAKKILFEKVLALVPAGRRRSEAEYDLEGLVYLAEGSLDEDALIELVAEALGFSRGDGERTFEIAPGGPQGPVTVQARTAQEAVASLLAEEAEAEAEYGDAAEDPNPNPRYFVRRRGSRGPWITVFLHDAIADPITAEPPDTLNGGDHDR